jgi:hypothetical protein
MAAHHLDRPHRTGNAVLRRFRAAALAATLACGPAFAHAANFQATINPSAITVTGPIEPGDDIRFQRIVDGLRRAGYGPALMVTLNSPGGLVSVAARIADLILAANRGCIIGFSANGRPIPCVVTDVWLGETCASACTLLFFAGGRRTLHEGGRLGVHRAVGPSGIETEASREVSVAMAGKLASMGVSRATIDRLLATPPDSITWLHATNSDFEFQTKEFDWCGSRGCSIPPAPAWGYSR